MNKICILCVDDEPEVLEAVERDLSMLEDYFPLETAASVDEAKTVLQLIAKRDDKLGVVFCDHVMPEETGVEFLVWMEAQVEWKRTRKTLLTGQAGLDATVTAVNEAGLDYYLAKPWTREKLLEVAKRQLTQYVIETDQSPLPYMSVLDAEMLAQAMHERGLVSDE